MHSVSCCVMTARRPTLARRETTKRPALSVTEIDDAFAHAPGSEDFTKATWTRETGCPPDIRWPSTICSISYEPPQPPTDKAHIAATTSRIATRPNDYVNRRPATAVR